MTMLYRKNDEVYEVHCYQGDVDALRTFVGETNLQVYNKGFTNVSPMIVVSTVFGPLAVRQGEFIVKHTSSGELRVHQPDTFANLYSSIDADDVEIDTIIDADSIGADADLPELGGES